MYHIPEFPQVQDSTELNPPKSYYYERATDADICVCCHDAPGEYAVTADDPKVCCPCLCRIEADNQREVCCG